MSAKLRRITSIVVAILTVLSSFTLLIPARYSVNAEATAVAVESEEALRSALEGDGGSYSLSTDINITVTGYEEFRYVVARVVSIDLNGHSITVTNIANLEDNTNDSTLIKVESTGHLTISDSSPNKTGSISYFGGIHKYSENNEYKDFKVVTGRHLLYLSKGSTLIINGGKLVAGNTEKEWLHRAAGVIDKKFEYYTGFAENTVCGTVITVDTQANLTVNGGSFEANGRKRQNILPNLKGWNEERPASVCIRAEAKANVVVNEGDFKGAHGADVFSLDPTSKSSIKAGRFETSPSVNERLADYMDFAAVNVSTYYGKLNLPTVFIPGNSRKSLYQNGATIEKTADAADGIPVYLIPDTADFASVTSSLTSGSYTPGAKGTLKSGYTQYFTADSEITYSWYAISPSGSVTSIPNSNYDSIDLSKLPGKGITLAVGSRYSFACVITETFKNYTLTTVSRTLNLDTTNKNILAAVSLTPSAIDDNNRYYSGNAPTFKVPSNANYVIDSVKWYERSSVNQMESPVKFEENSNYFVVFELSAKGNYLFTSDTRIAFLPGATSTSLAPSVDGKNATISAWISTACSHATTEYVGNPHSHDKICTICGYAISASKHEFSEWAEDGASGETQPMSRICGICSYKECSAVFVPVENEKTPVYEIKVDLGVPTESSAPATPTIASTPDSGKVIIDSYTWTTDSGASFTKFESGKKYVLTVVYKLVDPETTVFSDWTILSTNHCSTSTRSLNDDKTELTAKYYVETVYVGDRQIYLPTISIGQQISNANINIYGNATVHWYKDGKKIGYCDFSDNSETDYDYDPNDEVDFLTHEFEEGSMYCVRINWQTTDGNQVDKSKVTFTNAIPLGTSVVSGEYGFATAYFIPRVADKYVRSIKVTGIVEPVAGANAKTSGASVDSTCTVKSIVFTANGNKATKFACGKQYTVEVTVALKDGYEFALESATINGHGVTVTDSGENIILSYTFETIQHNIDNRNATVTLPTCDSDGSIVGKCKSCSAKSEITLDKLGHSLIEIIGIASTCKNDGISTHYYCFGCQKLYKDSNAVTEVAADSIIIKKDPSKHVGGTVTAHDGNNHFTVCVGCDSLLDEEIEHEYGDALIDSEGNEHYSCACGHSVPASGPKQPGFLIGGVEEEFTPPPTNGGFSFGGFSFDTIKTILILMMVFAILLIGSIIVISMILIITRDKSGNQLLPDELEEKKQLSSSQKK